MLGKALFQIVLATVVISPASANWGHWRGEYGNSVSSTSQPPTIWSPTENIKWRVAVPSRGSGSPVIWDKRVFLVTAVTAEESDVSNRSLARIRSLARMQFDLQCYNRDDGKTLWRCTTCEATPHEGTHGTSGFSSASPCTDGIYVLSLIHI